LLRLGSGGGFLLHLRLFGGQGMPRHLEAVDTDIVPDGISVQSVTTVDGITGIRRTGGRQAQQRYGTNHNTQRFHLHFLLLAIQKAKSSLGPIWKSV
jgi:hypothetical protein